MDELEEIRGLAREFAAAELRPNAEAWDHAGGMPAGVRAQLAELGFLGMRVPEAFGGAGFDTPTFVTALEALAWGEPAAALNVAVAAIAAESVAAHGSDAQRAARLPGIATGEQVPTLSLAAAEGAVDVAGSGDGARLDGTAAWLADPGAATFALIAAARAQGAAALCMVSTDADGWSAGERRLTMGLRPLAIADARLEGVRVAADDWLDADTADGGAAGAVETIRLLAVAAVAVGIADAAVDHAREYAGVREQFGRPIRTFQGIGRKLAEMRVRTDAARALLAEAARRHEAGGGDASTPLGARILAADTAMWVTTQAVQIFGGYGYMRDYPVEKLMRDARATGVLMGESDGLRDRVADTLYHD